MARTDRLSDEVERGHQAFDEGNLELADRACQRAERIDRNHPEVLLLGAVIAEENGDADAALERLEKLVANDPVDPTPRLIAARVLLDLRDDPKAALAMLEPGLDEIDDEEQLVDAVILKTSALLALGDPASRTAAGETLRELATEAIDDPGTSMMLAGLALDLEDVALCQRFLDRITILPASDDPEHQALAADKLHLEGELHGLRDDKAAQAAAWLEVRRLDLALTARDDDPGFRPPNPEISVHAEEVVEALPAKIRQHLLNVPILLDEVPSEELVRDGVDPRSLGLFSGTPMSEPTPMPSPTVIHLFVQNIAKFCGSADEFFEQLEITIWHETAHYFGLEDDDLDELGLG